MFWFFKKKKKKSEIFERLSEKLEQRKSEHIEEIKQKHKSVISWAKRRGIRVEEIAKQSARGLAAGVAAGAVIVSSGLPISEGTKQQSNTEKEIRNEIPDNTLQSSVKVKKDVSGEVKKTLSGEDMYNEKKISKKLSETLKIPVKVELDGIRLNKTYGVIGYESHLTRYPGDNLSTHFQSSVDREKYGRAGMAGGPGAWGYIAPSKQALTQKDIEREKYYLVAQTFLSPNWGSGEVKQWFRHRKMVVVNPANGQVVVGVLEDAGPEPSTGNSFGGSPEIIEALGFAGGGSDVLFYFVDDPDDKVPLGGYGL